MRQVQNGVRYGKLKKSYMAMKPISSLSTRTVSHLSYGYVFVVSPKNMGENQ